MRRNGREFLAEVGGRHGFETRLLSGQEEAELTYRGVTSRLEPVPGTLVCDIGGGSTELVLGGPDGVVDRDQPRHRLRAHVGALPALRPAHGRRGRRRFGAAAPASARAA